MATSSSRSQNAVKALARASPPCFWCERRAAQEGYQLVRGGREALVDLVELGFDQESVQIQGEDAGIDEALPGRGLGVAVRFF
ncbi:hypothetical protein [Streptomyces sp. NPDC059881]|uniref:hypothetical protein n=1 Tax=Streptomyces sp. NPDC059881 TaxID=3346986 RepID=UPI0036618C58